MAISTGGEALLQAALPPSGRLGKNTPAAPAAAVDPEMFAMLMQGQALASLPPALPGEKPDAPAAADAKPGLDLPGLQAQAMPWEALAAAAEEAGQLIALRQSLSLAPPVAAVTEPPAAIPSLPQAAAGLEAGAALPPPLAAELPPLPAEPPSGALPPLPDAGMPVADDTPPAALAAPTMASAAPITAPARPADLPRQPDPAQSLGQMANPVPASAPTPAPEPQNAAAALQAPPAVPVSSPPAPVMAAMAQAESAPAGAVPAKPAPPAGSARPPMRSAVSEASPRGQPPQAATQQGITGLAPVDEAASVATAAGDGNPALPQATLPEGDGTAGQIRIEDARTQPSHPVPWSGEVAPALAEEPPKPDTAALASAVPLINTQASTQDMAALKASAPSQASVHPRMVAEAAPQLVLRVKDAAENGVETISVDLRPPELGRVELRLTFREGTVQVVMMAERAETFEALRQERHSLMQQMEQSGLQLGGNGLDLQHGSFSWSERQAQEFEPEPTRQAGGPGEDEDEAGTAALLRRPASDSLIDIVA